MEKPKKPILYVDGYLTINIKESNPALLHQNLMRGLANASKNQMVCQTTDPSAIDGMLALIKLLENILPTESELSSAYEN